MLPPRSGSAAHQVVHRAQLCSAAGQRGAVMSTPGERVGGAPPQRVSSAMWPLPPWTGRRCVEQGWGHRPPAPRTLWPCPSRGLGHQSESVWECCPLGLGVLPCQTVTRAQLCSAAGQRGPVMSTQGSLSTACQECHVAGPPWKASDLRPCAPRGLCHETGLHTPQPGSVAQLGRPVSSGEKGDCLKFPRT